MRFRDRADAGRQLAHRLAAKYAGQDGVVYALPRGGVPLGAEIARRLHLPLDLLIARKIGHPFNPEYAIGAVTESGELASNPREVAQVRTEWFQHQIEVEREEARRRHRVYLSNRAPLSAAGKLAILVDDGIATGLTMEVAIRELRRQKPARLVVAVPVAPSDTAAKFARAVDDFVALDIPEYYLGAVGAYYEDFAQVTDDEVIALLHAVHPAPQPN